MKRQSVLFVDRDGTLIEEPADFQVDAIEKIRLVPGVIAALQRLIVSGYRLVMVTNQDGLGTDSFPTASFESAHEFALDLFSTQGIRFDEVLICPHLPAEHCDCRKPATGLLTRYLIDNPIDSQRSAVIGDRETDVTLADNLGIQGFKLGDAWNWVTIADELCLQPRRASVVRKTNETAIEVSVNLDSASEVRLETGIGFLDHMLEQISRHGGIGLNIVCRGDLHIDDHHSVEDIALALGEALRNALGSKAGIERYGFALPMDEAQAKAVIDLSGRPICRFEADIPGTAVGELSIPMVKHFFQSFAVALGAAIHIEADGDNAHHIVEGCFKALGKALGQAVARGQSGIPSTKGQL